MGHTKKFDLIRSSATLASGKMLPTVVFVSLLAVAVAVPVAMDSVLSIDRDNHKHTQSGQAGTAVTGSYEVIGVDGSIRVVNYIADERGFRIIGSGKVDKPSLPVTNYLPPPTTTVSIEYLPPPATTASPVYLPPPTTTTAATTTAAFPEMYRYPAASTPSVPFYLPIDATTTTTAATTTSVPFFLPDGASW